MSDPDGLPSTYIDFFRGTLSNLEFGWEPSSTGETQYEELGSYASRIIIQSTLYGEPAEGGVGTATDLVQNMLMGKRWQSEDMRERLKGVFDVLAAASSVLPPQLDKHDFAELSRVNTLGPLPLGTVGLSAIGTSLVRKRRVGHEKWVVEITPRGQEAIAAHLRRQSQTE
jgi:hypothetical protein